MFAKRSLLLFALAALALAAPARGPAQDKKGPALPEGTKVETDLAYGPHHGSCALGVTSLAPSCRVW
jgi:hypothetical protein